MPGKIFYTKLAVSVAITLFVGGGFYSLWHHQQVAEKPVAEIKIEDTGKFKLVEDTSTGSAQASPVKKPSKKVATAAIVSKPMATVINIVAPILAPEVLPAPEPSQVPVTSQQVSTPTQTQTSVVQSAPATEPASAPAPEPLIQPQPEPTSPPPPAPESTPDPGSQPTAQPEPVKVVISEIQTGTEAGGTEDEFIKLYNPTNSEINLSGWALKKKTSSGSFQNLVSAGAFSGKIPAKDYFVIAHANYKGTLTVNLYYSANSNNLSYTNNTAVLYSADGNIMDEVQWTEIPKDQIWQRP